MDIEEARDYIRHARRKIANAENVLDLIEDSDELRNRIRLLIPTDCSLLMKHSESVGAHLPLLSDYFGRYKMEHYYPWGDNSLAVSYYFKDYDLKCVLRIPIQNLDKISSGKCRVVEKKQEKVKKTIVCDIKEKK
jgi:hypothetical protein